MDINKIISIIREQAIAAPTNNVGDGQIGGTVEAGDDPPVKKKKKRKPTPVGRYGSRRAWLDNLNDNGK
tara:strand:- start:76 stop:282 length:207 start_codon:yes stop_codon:yes gene_type:complete